MLKLKKVSPIHRISLFFFFFSSRRRHTRSKRDWSSDVCSSDLITSGKKAIAAISVATVLSSPPDIAAMAFFPEVISRSLAVWADKKLAGWKPWKIERASCRERVKMLEGVVAV